MIYPIVIWPSPVLSAMAKPFVWSEGFQAEDYLDQLTTVMEAAMQKARGIGIAAPQIGVSTRVILAIDYHGGGKPGEKPKILVNPEIINAETEVDSIGEMCLSVPGEKIDMIRFKKIQVMYQDERGDRCEINAEGFFAIELQHEIDHLNGKLIVDGLSPLKKMIVRDRMRKQQKRQRKMGDTWKNLDELGSKLLVPIKLHS